MEMSTFGKEVRKAMIDADLNQSLLAEEMGVSQAYVSAILNGHKRVPPAFLASIEALGLLTQAMRVEYFRERGTLDIDGLESDEVAELVRRVDAMRGIVR
jgi:transcriptional regulator with XRE-family HTH domain